MSDSRTQMDENRAHWDEMAALHPTTEFYNLEGFKRDRTQLDSIVREQLGDIAGKSALHLQCHFGMDTLRLAWMGAQATGADFSPTAIATARALADELETPATFVESNVYDLLDNLDAQFDVVFTSHGAITWLPDIRAWARVVGHFLKPGGRFVIVNGHPATWMLDDEHPDALVIKYPYFVTGSPLTLEQDGSYADASASISNKRTHSWNHPLGEVITALIDAGLTIEHVGEYSYCSWRMVPLMYEDSEGWWQLPEQFPSLPFLFSIRASKR